MKKQLKFKVGQLVEYVLVENVLFFGTIIEIDNNESNKPYIIQANDGSVKYANEEFLRLPQNIGKGYWQSGHGRGFKKTSNIHLIGGKAYARDTVNYHHVTSNLVGYIPVNFENNIWCQVWPHNHNLFQKH